MTTPDRIIGFIETQTGHALQPDEGLQRGDGECSLSGVTVAWMATPDAIRAASARPERVGHTIRAAAWVAQAVWPPPT